ncbi:DUF3108 domain-containing protein [Vibrio sp. RC27]
MIKLIFKLLILIAAFSHLSYADEQTVKETTDVAKSTHKHFVYEVSYSGIKIGKIDRDERHNNNRYYLSLSADLSFLFLNLSGFQNSTALWQEDKQWFKAISLDRKTKGFDTKRVKAKISDDSLSSTVEFEGKTSFYETKKGPITELNAMFLQVRAGLMNGQKAFDFYMQTSDGIDHHFFEVKDEEIIETKFGEFKTFRIEQTQVKNRALSIWYAPDLDMQMVKFYYERKIVNLTGELTNYYLK